MNTSSFQCAQTAPRPIFGLERASGDWAQCWMSTRGHAAQEQKKFNSTQKTFTK